MRRLVESEEGGALVGRGALGRGLRPIPIVPRASRSATEVPPAGDGMYCPFYSPAWPWLLCLGKNKKLLKKKKAHTVVGCVISTPRNSWKLDVS